jgi:hypothetical protein
MTTLETTMPPNPTYPPTTRLHAGPVSLLFSNGDLRHLRVGGIEIVQRLYVAVRDHNWNTIPVTLEDLVIDDYGDHFRITFNAIHQQEDIGFHWQGSVEGDVDGTIKMRMDGQADTTFRRNRIGFCVLHPASVAGASVTLEHSDGSQSHSQFPLLIAPHQPFFNLHAIRHVVVPGLEAETGFEGDIFETEDQRNWTDASFKTYSTPLSIPYPVTVEAETVVRQAVTVRLIGRIPDSTVAGSAIQPLTVNVGNDPVATLPALGLGSASHGQPLTEREADALRLLNLDHLRVDLNLSQDDFGATLARAAQDAKAIDAALEIALLVGENAASELVEFSNTFNQMQVGKVARWLLFASNEPVTPIELLEQARPTLETLRPGVSIGGGTNIYFTNLNRSRPPVEALDFVSYSINPQVHAFDLISLVENLVAQPMTVESAKAFSTDRPIVISPITLRPRSNPDATGPEPEPVAGQLPDAVDARQPTGFAAGWTLGSLSNLAEAGVASLTYYETTGWRGVMEQEQGSPLPDLFPSQPGQFFPIYHLFAALAPFAGGQLLPVDVSNPLQVAALTLVAGDRLCTLVANLTDKDQRVALYGLHWPVTMQTLGDPAGSIEFEQEQTPLWIDLAPFTLVNLG